MCKNQPRLKSKLLQMPIDFKMLYFHFNFKNVTYSLDQTTNYQFSLNKLI